jgi:hypothetical protein
VKNSIDTDIDLITTTSAISTGMQRRIQPNLSQNVCGLVGRKGALHLLRLNGARCNTAR